MIEKIKKFSAGSIISLIIICIVFYNMNLIYGSTATSEWFSKSNSWFETSKSGFTTPDNYQEIINTIKLAGNAVIIVATIFLGIKYMYGSAEGKVDVKEGLFTLFVAMLFFYGGSAIFDIFVSGNKLKIIGTNEAATIANVYSTIVYLANFVGVGAIIYVGVKYLASGAEGKGELKGKSLTFFIGMVMTFVTLSLLNFIREIIVNVV